MDIDRFVAKKVAGTFSYYKKLEIDGITYYFETETEYKTFMDNEVYLWSTYFNDKAIEVFNKKDFSIYFVDKIYEGDVEVADGTCIYGGENNFNAANAILVQSIDNPSVILHEFGHFLDFCMSKDPHVYSSEEPKLKQIMLEEIDSFVKCFLMFYHLFGSKRELIKINDITAIAHSSYYFEPREYYAESIAMYLMLPDYYKSKCPKTYDYLTEKLNGILWEE